MTKSGMVKMEHVEVSRADDGSIWDNKRNTRRKAGLLFKAYANLALLLNTSERGELLVASSSSTHPDVAKKYDMVSVSENRKYQRSDLTTPWNDPLKRALHDDKCQELEREKRGVCQ
jgi:hypothetical protein